MAERLNPFLRFLRQPAFQRPMDHPVNDFPFYVDIEPTNACNLKCIMCKRQIMTRPVGYMEEAVYRRIVDEMAGYNAGLRFCRHGEPTLHPRLPELIAYANELKVVNYVSTNGFYGQNVMERLVAARPDVVRFSFQGLTPDECERFRPPARFAVVAANIHRCVQQRQANGWLRPYLIISTSILDEPPEQVAAFRNQWEAIVDRVEVGRTTFSWVEAAGDHTSDKARVTVARHYIPCLELMTKISVNWNGDITACCGDYNGEMVIGNIADMTLKQAWDSARETYFRGMVTHDTRHAELPLCQHCFKGDYKFKENPV